MQPPSLHGTRLILIDDDLLSREVLELLATEAGFLVDSYESGEAALDALGAAPVRLPDTVLVDMQMPGLCGDPLAERLRGPCGDKTVLLAMSGTPVPPDAIRNYDGFLLKPFSIDDLADAIAGSPARSRSPQSMEGPAELAHVLSLTTYEALAQTMSPAQLRSLYAMCLDDADARIATLVKASEDRDEDSFRRAAHSIKGGCGMVGALELARMAAEMEERGLPAIDNKAPFEQFLSASARLRRILDAR